jgi:hypothetical protein
MPSAPSVSQSHDVPDAVSISCHYVCVLHHHAPDGDAPQATWDDSASPATNDNGRHPRTGASHRPALTAVAVASESGIQVWKGCLMPLIVVHKARPARRAEHPQAR